MKHTLSYNRQLFNVKAIASAGLSPEAIPDNTLGIIDVTTDKTVVPGSYIDLPNKFRLVHKINGNLFYGFDCIDKNKIVTSQPKEYKKAKTNKWEGVVEFCDCIDTVRLNVYLQDEALNRTMGLTWGTTDIYVEVSPEEFKCYCSCNEAGAYANNVLTMLLYKQLLKHNSSFYKASVATKDDAQQFANLKEVEAFVAANKEVNTNENKADDGKLLKLIIEGKEVAKPKRFNPYNVKDVYPSGVRLLPSFVVNGKTVISFKEIQPLEFEVGSGLDLVIEEHDNISYYSDMRMYARNMHLVELPEYQFEESKKYDTLTVEFDTPKTLRAGEADCKRFILIFGSETDFNTDVHKKLVKIFTPQ